MPPVTRSEGHRRRHAGRMGKETHRAGRDLSESWQQAEVVYDTCPAQILPTLDRQFGWAGRATSVAPTGAERRPSKRGTLALATRARRRLAQNDWEPELMSLSCSDLIARSRLSLAELASCGRLLHAVGILAAFAQLVAVRAMNSVAVMWPALNRCRPPSQ